MDRTTIFVKNMTTIIWVALPLYLQASEDPVSERNKEEVRFSVPAALPSPINQKGEWIHSKGKSYIWKEPTEDKDRPFIEYSVEAIPSEILADSIEKAYRLSDYSISIEVDPLPNKNILMKVINEKKNEYELNLLIPSEPNKSSLIRVKTTNKIDLTELEKILKKY